MTAEVPATETRRTETGMTIPETAETPATEIRETEIRGTEIRGTEIHGITIHGITILAKAEALPHGAVEIPVTETIHATTTVEAPGAAVEIHATETTIVTHKTGIRGTAAAREIEAREIHKIPATEIRETVAKAIRTRTRTRTRTRVTLAPVQEVALDHLPRETGVEAEAATAAEAVVVAELKATGTEAGIAIPTTETLAIVPKAVAIIQTIAIAVAGDPMSQSNLMNQN